jgi:hypothetical protein
MRKSRPHIECAAFENESVPLCHKLYNAPAAVLDPQSIPLADVATSQARRCVMNATV